MISRRLFLEALASLALVPAVAAAGRTTTPILTWKSRLRILDGSGFLLAEIDLTAEDTGRDQSARGEGAIVASGTAQRYALELPDGKVLVGDIAIEGDCGLRFNQCRLVDGGRIAIDGIIHDIA